MKKLFLHFVLVLTLIIGTMKASAQITWTITASTNGNKTTFTIARSGAYLPAQAVGYRTIGLSAFEGQHFYAMNGTLSFNENEPSKSVEVTEKTNPSGMFKYQEGSTRRYRFEVYDHNGSQLAYNDHDMTVGTSISSTAFQEKTVNVQSNQITVTDDGYAQAYYAVPLSSYFNSSAPQSYFTSLDVSELRMLVTFDAREKSDGYQYIQIIHNNTTGCDTGAKDGDPGKPSLSRYMAGFTIDGNVSSTFYSYTFPVTAYGSSCGYHEHPWSGNPKGNLEQQYFKSGCRATDGRLIIPANLNTVGIRFDASGHQNDDWYAKNVKAKIQAIDGTAPTVTTNSIKVSEGIYMTGNSMYVSVPFSEIVVVNGNPTLSTSWGIFNYLYGSGSNVLTFKCDNISPIIDNFSIISINTNQNTNTVKDRYGNALSGGINKSFSKYFATKYTISYDLGDNTLPGGLSNPTTYCSQSLDIRLINPVVPIGHSFTGWTGSNGSTPQTEVVIAHGSIGNKNYTVNMPAYTYTVHFDKNAEGATGSMADQQFTYGVAQNLTANGFSYTGHVFQKWNTAPDGTGDWYDNGQEVVNLTAVNNATVTLYAQWPTEIYTITYDLAGGTMPSDMTNPSNYSVESGDITLKNPIRMGYHFDGWTGSNGSTPQTNVVIPHASTGNRSYIANWTFIWGTEGTSDGTEDHPYIITSTEGLDMIAYYTNNGIDDFDNKQFRLGGDINYSYDGLGADESNYTAIGTFISDRRFSGDFDGDGHTISGIRIRKSDSDYQALFGCTSGSIISNIILTDAEIIGHECVGGIAGFGCNSGRVHNCIVDGVTIIGSEGAAVVSLGYLMVSDSYYLNCNVNGNAINVGTKYGDSDGARSIHLITFGEHIIATGTIVTYNMITYAAAETTISMRYDEPHYGFIPVYTVNGEPIEGSEFTMPTAATTVSVALEPSDYVFIGDGNEGGHYLPSEFVYRYSYSQQIYTSAEIGPANVIESIGFYCLSDAYAVRNWDIYMVSTEKSCFNGDDDWIAVTAADLVFSGEVSLLANQWTQIQLDNPFDYDGVKNVALIVDDNTGSYVSSTDFKVFEVSDFQALYSYTDDEDIDPLDLKTAYNNNASSKKNQLRVGMSTNGCPAPNKLTATVINGSEVELGWIEKGNATHWQICLNGDEEHLIEANANPFMLKNLTPETSYTAEVRSCCDGNEHSKWSNMVRIETTNKTCIGSGNGFGEYLPTNNWYSYSLTQQIYTTQEMGAAGRIVSVDFYSMKNITRSLDIYMMSTDKEVFDSDEGFVIPAADDRVFSGEVSFQQDQWTTIEFSNDFIYDGLHHVVLIVDDNTGGFGASVDFKTFDANNQAIYLHVDYADIDPTNVNGFVNLSDQKNQIRVMKTGFESCEKTINLKTTESHHNRATLDWTEVGEATEWVVCYNDGASDHTVTVNEHPYTLTGLTPETSYTVKVRPACDENLWSKTVSFTTNEECPTPRDFAITHIGHNSATVSWWGDSEYTLRLGAETTIDILKSVDFEDGVIPNDFINDSTYPWTVVEDVSGIGYCIKCGNSDKHGSTSDISLTVTYEHDGVVLFDAKCMGEGSTPIWDACEFYIDDHLEMQRGANGDAWESYRFEVASGEHTFKWRYSKDTSVNPEGDFFAVGHIVMKTTQITWQPDVMDLMENFHSFSGLTANTKYYVQVVAECGANPESDIVIFNTLPINEKHFIHEGAWNVAANWMESHMPESYDRVVVFADVTVPNGCVAQAGVISLDEDASPTFTIADGGQLICNNQVAIKMEKQVGAWDDVAKTGWYVLSSPVDSPDFSEVENMTERAHNIYSYNPFVIEWEEYRNDNNIFSSFDVPKGYLYRREDAKTIVFDGDANYGKIRYYLNYTEDGDVRQKFNLIGNPYPHTIYKGVAISNDYLEEGFCTLNTNGTWTYHNDSDPVPPCTGILVQAKAADFVTISQTAAAPNPSKSAYNDNIWFTVENSQFKDVANVEFKDGHGYNKMAHHNEDAPMLYVRYNDEDFASADVSTDAKAVDLYFKTMTTGKFTLSFNAQGDFSYLHLIDRLTGADVDMLQENKYEFIGKPGDCKERFQVRLEQVGDADDMALTESFVYQSGADIIVEGKGELRVFDVLGRMVLQKRVNGVEAIEKPSPAGVYFFRMNEKTQKIVVR